MDIKIILGWSITILTMAGLVIFFWARNKKNSKKALAPLIAFAREYHSEISDYDLWDKNAIGIAGNEISDLFFIRNIPGMEIREHINLTAVSDCRMFKTERSVIYNKETVIVVDRIELKISFYKHKPEVCLEFYNADYDSLTLSGELQLAQKWNDTIRGMISTTRDRRALEHKKGLVHSLNAPNGRPAINNNAYVSPKKVKRPKQKENAIR